jgi:hypothetical protein
MRKTPSLKSLSRRQLIALRKQIERALTRKRREVEEELALIASRANPGDSPRTQKVRHR